jgi:drug/metabolite transporter (DMT)-like permease
MLGGPQWAITLETARTVALAAAIAIVVAAVATLWVFKQVMSKLIAAGLLVVVAGLVWSQRSALDDCADRVHARLESGPETDGTCTFFGRDVTVDGG